MVVWCKICSAFMGIREPYPDWSVDRNALCPACAANEKIITIEEAYSLSDSDDGSVVSDSDDGSVVVGALD